MALHDHPRRSNRSQTASLIPPPVIGPLTWLVASPSGSQEGGGSRHHTLFLSWAAKFEPPSAKPALVDAGTPNKLPGHGTTLFCRLPIAQNPRAPRGGHAHISLRFSRYRRLPLFAKGWCWPCSPPPGKANDAPRGAVHACTQRPAAVGMMMRAAKCKHAYKRGVGCSEGGVWDRVN